LLLCTGVKILIRTSFVLRIAQLYWDLNETAGAVRYNDTLASSQTTLTIVEPVMKLPS